MSAPLILTLTTAGYDALVDAQNGQTAAIRITQIGFTESQFLLAPTLTALPGEFKRIGTLSGQATSPTQLHMTAQDSSADAYSLRGFGLYLEDGTLFGVYGGEDALFTKVAKSSFLFVADVAFVDAVTDSIEFGDATFLYPPATETVKGVAEIATQDEVDAGTDDERIVTPLKLATLIAAVVGGFVSATENVEGVAELATQAETDAGTDDARIVTPLKLATFIAAELLALRQGITITTAGLASGGGDLSQNREIDVLAASIADVAAAVANDRAVTPASLSDVLADIAGRALATRLITGTGLLTGGGNLTADRVLDVRAATAAEVRAGGFADRAITPAALGPIIKSFGASSGYMSIPSGDPANTLLFQYGRRFCPANSNSAVSFPLAFSQSAFSVVMSGTSDSSLGAEENAPNVVTTSIGSAGFTIRNPNDEGDQVNWQAFGRIDLS